jgi:hypothetical protein
MFAGEDDKVFLQSGKVFFFDGTFNSCPEQFSHLYTINVDCGNTIFESNIYPSIFVLLPALVISSAGVPNGVQI